MISRHRIKESIAASEPFIAHIASNMILRPSNISTLATDGLHLFYDETFVQSVTNDDLQIYLAHEILHAALGHCFVNDNRDPVIWNLAADYQVNSVLSECGYRLPSDSMMFDPLYNCLSAQEIYVKLKQSRATFDVSLPPVNYLRFDITSTGSTQRRKAERMQRLVIEAVDLAGGTGNLARYFNGLVFRDHG